MLSELQLRYAASDDIPKLAGVLGAAFMNDPVSGYVFPGREERAILHPPFFRVNLSHAITHGTAYTTMDLDGAALWFNVDSPPTERLSREEEEDFARACGPFFPRFVLLVGQGYLVRAELPIPHAYLSFIGVHPDAQGKGIGTALMRHKLNVLDRERRPAYLECSNENDFPFYERLGFRHIPRPIQVAGAHPVGFDPESRAVLPRGPVLYPMWRDPVAL